MLLEERDAWKGARVSRVRNIIRRLSDLRVSRRLVQRVEHRSIDCATLTNTNGMKHSKRQGRREDVFLHTMSEYSLEERTRPLKSSFFSIDRSEVHQGVEQTDVIISTPHTAPVRVKEIIETSEETCSQLQSSVAADEGHVSQFRIARLFPIELL